ncbi:zincin [Choiromyces venosus 120613-1]|uniref:Zincin n=1 Tax=Choiromyces venosus 120613-1 TaxID=1336337 RepID=A0A3N4K2W0_9PEZI|nr:zincin [Choiromyces venosus 120613-1]
MKTFGIFSLAVLASNVFAAPAPTTNVAATGIPSATPHLGPVGIEIHGSCNVTERRQLTVALTELEELVSTVQSHLLRTGTSSQIFKKWFGANAATAEVLGWFTLILSASKPETVICPLSYTSRRPLTEMCALGYNVASYKTSFFFASDLLHRVFHVPVLAEGVDALDLAKDGNGSLAWFALEVYAYEVGNPGIGCAGVRAASSTTAATTSTTAAPSSKPSTSMIPPPLPTRPTTTTTTTTTQPPTATFSASLHCRTHSDGMVHCD